MFASPLKLKWIYYRNHLSSRWAPSIKTSQAPPRTERNASRLPVLALFTCGRRAGRVTQRLMKSL